MATVSIQSPGAPATVHPGDAIEIRWTSQGARLHDVAMEVDAQKQSIAAGQASVHGNSDWVWGYDPVGEWNKEPAVPTVYAA